MFHLHRLKQLYTYDPSSSCADVSPINTTTVEREKKDENELILFLLQRTGFFRFFGAAQFITQYSCWERERERERRGPGMKVIPQSRARNVPFGIGRVCSCVSRERGYTHIHV